MVHALTLGIYPKEMKEIFALSYSLQHYPQEPRGGNNLNIH